MHNINYEVFSVKMSERDMNDELNRYVNQATWQEGGHGLDHPIRFIDKVMPDYTDAKEFIEKNDKGWYDCLAVKFKEMPRTKTTKKLDDLRQKRKDIALEYNELNQKVFAVEFKAEYVGCKHCGSKINRNYIKSNFCPICRNDMRSETTLKKLNAMKAKIEKIDKEIREEEKKICEKYGEVKWLVKYEYHT